MTSVYNSEQDTWDPRFLWLELLLNLGIRKHSHVKRGAVTTVFTEILCLKEDVKLQRLNTSNNRKRSLGRGL